jgi:arginine exporter protein ArgO
MVQDQTFAVNAVLRVVNKCSISLYDVYVIVYGVQGPGILTDPSTIFQEEVKKNSGFAFQISIDKACLEENCFNIQISYRTDSLAKKKTNFKIPLPLIQMINPEFVYS